VSTGIAAATAKAIAAAPFAVRPMGREPLDALRSFRSKNTAFLLLMATPRATAGAKEMR
jgi:hypothetical protein